MSIQKANAMGAQIKKWSQRPEPNREDFVNRNGLGPLIHRDVHFQLFTESLGWARHGARNKGCEDGKHVVSTSKDS